MPDGPSRSSTWPFARAENGTGRLAGRPIILSQKNRSSPEERGYLRRASSASFSGTSSPSHSNIGKSRRSPSEKRV